jgi:coenzyme PQQ precursor peptide PqqA
LAIRRGGDKRTLGSEAGQSPRFLQRHGSNHRSKLMKWETPQASDTRYGFEITMYIATR